MTQSLSIPTFIIGQTKAMAENWRAVNGIGRRNCWTAGLENLSRVAGNLQGMRGGRIVLIGAMPDLITDSVERCCLPSGGNYTIERWDE